MTQVAAQTLQGDNGASEVVELDTGGPDEALHDALPRVFSKREAAKVVVAETGCNLNEARNMIEWLDNFVKRSRNNGHSTVYPRTGQMRGRNYKIFDQIMPHGTAPTPGSAADAVNQALLDPTAGETYILHDQTSRYHAVYCSVQVQTLAVQLN